MKKLKSKVLGITFHGMMQKSKVKPTNIKSTYLGAIFSEGAYYHLDVLVQKQLLNIIKEMKNMQTTVTNEHLRKEFDDFEKTEELGNLLEELKYSTLIAPVDGVYEGFAMIEMAGNTYIPLFTDVHEYQKVKFDGNIRPKSFEFNFYLEILQKGDIEGFVVNVESERFPITKEFLEFMDTNYMFDLDFQPFTFKEIRNVYDSINNVELEEFLKNKDNHWDLDSLMDILLKSDLLTVVASKSSFDEFQNNGVISRMDMGELSNCRSRDGCAMIFSSRQKINCSSENNKIYAQLVNLPLFIDDVLKSDLAGIRIDENIVISRDFLINFMKDFNCPNLDGCDSYVFILGDGK